MGDKKILRVKGYSNIDKICWSKFSPNEYKIEDVWFMGHYIWKVVLVRKA